ncbi:MAG: hypothetical protein JW904_11580 [Spirochaetales bacterium]|nr:hypothetical protein [Spirochaetales bacterium]
MKIYTLTVTIAPSGSKEITAFSFPALGAVGVIDQENHTIAVTIPYGSSKSSLVASFTATGQSVRIGSTVQTSGVTVNSFGSPKAYTVVAADETTQDYTVTVTNALNPAKCFWTFGFSSLGVAGTVNEAAHTISVNVPHGTDVTGLVATFSYAGNSVRIGAAQQFSGVTVNNFTNPVTYTSLSEGQ